MDADGLPLVGPGLDYTKIEAINQRRMIAFVNHFISHTVQFLNHFSVVCEEKLSDINVKIQRLEATASILETKLSFIPGLENVTAPTTTTSQPPPATTTDSQPTQPQPSQPTPAEPTPVQEAPKEDVPPSMTVAQDPRFARFFKLLKMQVPMGAVKQKMSIEGLNPDLLDTPNAPAPPPDNPNSDDDDSDGSDSASDGDW